MKVVLLKDVPKVGKKNQVYDVADGFARNSLLPRGLAVAATPAAIDRAKREVAAKQEKEATTERAIEELLKRSEAEPLLLSREANEKGSLFRGVRAIDLAEAAKKAYGVDLAERDIILDAPLKEAGAHKIAVHHGNIRGHLHVLISAGI